MTDKNMINGINVSNCKYFNNGWCLLSESCDAIKYKPCGDMTLFDCYFKQLKRKEQECEELKAENFTFEELIKTQEELIDKYKQASIR